MRYPRMQICIMLMVMIPGCKNEEAKTTPTNTEQAAAKAAPAASAGPGNVDPASPLRDPSRVNATAPKKYTVKLETTKGEVLIDVNRGWAPRGADRFYSLVKAGYYDNVAFYRVISGFMAQVGLHGDPAVNAAWREQRIPDDPVTQSNTRGMLSFAMAGPDSRTTQIFFNFGDNSKLDAMGFAPFGKVRDMKAIDALYSEYGEGAPGGFGPAQGRIRAEGNTYLKAEFPKLDYITRASIVE